MGAAEPVWTWASAVSSRPSYQVRADAEAGVSLRLLHGAYGPGRHPIDAVRYWQACLLVSGSGAVLCGRSAARLWSLPLVDDADPATGAWQEAFDDVATRGSNRARSGPGRVLVRHRLTLEPDEVTELSGLPVTTVGRTLLDCARLLDLPAVVCLVDAALQRRLVRSSELSRLAERHAGRRGAARFRAAVALADGRAESPLETLGRLVLLPVLPGLVPQLAVRDARGGFLARVDLAEPRLRLAIEGDGQSVHGTPAAVARDRWRQDRLAEAGWATERFTWHDVRCRAEQLQGRVGRAARRAAAALGRTRA